MLSTSTDENIQYVHVHQNGMPSMVPYSVCSLLYYLPTFKVYINYIITASMVLLLVSFGSCSTFRR
jgi:hypothetical protein